MGWARVALLPALPYSADGAAQGCVVGLALERQQGVHAIAGGPRQDFDAWPGDFALAAPGVPIFSESGQGGEYLLLILDPVASAETAPALAAMEVPRRMFRGDRQAVALAQVLRRSLLAPAIELDSGLVAQQAAMLLVRGVALAQGPAGPQAAEAVTADLTASQAERALLGRILERIEAELDSPLSLAELAQQAGMSLLGFLRRFAALTGVTPHAYIMERRLQRARHLLCGGTAPLADIAAACGFAHQSHLGALLKRGVGLSPQQYRKLYRRQ